MTSQEDIAEAERLKVLGNELYQQGEYDAAQHKYDEAIKKNPNNAVLYANRGAVHLATKHYLEAAFDCKKSVDLDPKYAKAWGRLGTATHELSDWTKCVDAWQNALDCLPKKNLTAAEKALKAQFTAGLNKALVARRKIETGIVNLDKRSRNTPWHKAEALVSAKQAAMKPSCVFVIKYAYDALKEGIRKMNALHVIKDSRGREMTRGEKQAMQDLTNCIMADDRVFHLEDPKAFLEKHHMQIILENESNRGFLDEGSPTEIRQKILQRLKTETWDTVRPAIATTIRIWIFEGFFRYRMFGSFGFAFEMYSNTIDFLEWGRKQWPNVPDSKRGVIFKESFIRGVKRLHLGLMHGSVATSRTKGEDGPYGFSDLIDAATELLEDVNSAPVGDVFIGDILAFWSYVKGDALSILGWCNLEQGMIAERVDGDKEKSLSLIKTASEYYLSAAMAYPEDEPHRSEFLRKYLECLCQLEKPLRDTLPVCGIIRAAIPQALEVYATAPFNEQLKKNLSEVEQFESRNKKAIVEGRLTLDSVEKITIPRISMDKIKTEKDKLPFQILYPGDEGYEESVKP